MLDLLESVDRDSNQSQRGLALRFGVAVGLINAYLKICTKKGYVKVRRMPAHRRVYLLTPKGLAEKSRLALVLLGNQLEQFRRARADYAQVFAEARRRGWRKVVLIGASDLAEISVICAREADVEIVALVDAGLRQDRFVGVPVVAALSGIVAACDGALITELNAAHQTFAAAVEEFGAGRILAPALLGLTLTARPI